jgi:hypothetical protein
VIHEYDIIIEISVNFHRLLTQKFRSKNPIWIKSDAQSSGFHPFFHTPAGSAIAVR